MKNGNFVAVVMAIATAFIGGFIVGAEEIKHNFDQLFADMQVESAKQLPVPPSAMPHLQLSVTPSVSKFIERPEFVGHDEDQIIRLYHRGPRFLTDKHIAESLLAIDGVIQVRESAYMFEITKSPNFEWNEIFPFEYRHL